MPFVRIEWFVHSLWFDLWELEDEETGGDDEPEKFMVFAKVPFWLNRSKKLRLSACWAAALPPFRFLDLLDDNAWLNLCFGGVSRLLRERWRL